MIGLTQFTNLNNVVPWGLWVSIYIWLVGISAGVFALVVWGNIQGNPHLKKITRLGLILALSTLCAGLLSIQIDLGHIERFYKLFIAPNFGSVMAVMVWLYGVYFAILAASVFLSKKGIPKPLSMFFLVFALGIILVESLLFARPAGKHWHSLIFPIHFLTSSLVSAVAALIFAVGILWIKDKKTELLLGLSKIALPLIIINLIVEIVDIFSFEAFGQLENWVLLLCNIIAIALLRKRTSVSITIAGCIELMVVLFSKYNGLISAQIIEPFKGFSRSYIEPLLLANYAPNGFEFFAAVLLIGLAAGLFYFLYKIFPLTKEGG